MARCYNGVTYLAAKAATELPLDAACAVLFAVVVHWLCALRADLPSFAAGVGGGGGAGQGSQG
ncbi:unnamed protein product [Prorocentrum cordatum]|uniref:Uncharacterized protein n=1 Tax=Prorocentrum cordatum TaxID=2364126 RepID=A0ABN9XR69_9DINO|nr:unnamed protein product [Polarella glacialis]